MSSFEQDIEDNPAASAVLERLLAVLPNDRVSLGWFHDELPEHSFEMIAFILALIGVLPGASVMIGLAMVVPATGMMLSNGVRLPSVMAERSISAKPGALCHCTRHSVAALVGSGRPSAASAHLEAGEAGCGASGTPAGRDAPGTRAAQQCSAGPGDRRARARILRGQFHIALAVHIGLRRRELARGDGGHTDCRLASLRECVALDLGTLIVCIQNNISSSADIWCPPAQLRNRCSTILPHSNSMRPPVPMGHVGVPG